MRTLVVFLVFLFLFGVRAIAQNANIKDFIDAWKVADTSQSHRAKETYSVLQKKYSVLKYQQTVNALYDYQDRNRDQRLKVRIILFDVMGKRTFKLKSTTADVLKLKEAIKLAHQLKDEQLLADVYTQCSGINMEGNLLLYSLKAIELQEKIGFEHFSFVHNRFFYASLALYKAADYEQSISYGLRCLKFKDLVLEKWQRWIFNYQLDIVGASYLQLKQYNKAKYYYQQLLDTLIQQPDEDMLLQKLWVGVAKGNIGHILSLQNRDNEAIPLLKEHLAIGIESGELNNAAMAQNVLSAIDAKRKDYNAALSGYKRAYYWALKSNALRQTITAAQGLANIYRLTHNADSVFRYYSLFHQYQDSLNVQINRGRLSAVNAKFTFEKTVSNLEQANTTISQQRTIRNYALLAMVLLILTALLFYNRKMLRQKVLTQQIQAKKEKAETEVKFAKKQMDVFTENIIQKNKLIAQFQTQLQIANAEHKLSKEYVSNFVLLTNEESEKFRTDFFKAYPEFLLRLKSKLGQITPAEERLSALLYLNLTTTQIANTLGISEESVGRSKRRLKQRLNLSPDELLEDYLRELIYTNVYT